ncbi:MAG: hypothetical protein SNH94_04625 [Rikenellaceae bacterium]
MKKLLLNMALFCAAISCTEVSIEETTALLNDENLTQVTVTVAANCDESTRVSVDEQWRVTWDEGESLLALSTSDYTTSEFTMTSDYSAETSTFTGAISGTKYRLIAPLQHR